jgi:hypothetical protein
MIKIVYIIEYIIARRDWEELGNCVIDRGYAVTRKRGFSLEGGGFLLF